MKDVRERQQSAFSVNHNMHTGQFKNKSIYFLFSFQAPTSGGADPSSVLVNRVTFLCFEAHVVQQMVTHKLYCEKFIPASFFLSPSEASKAAHQSAVVDTPPHSALSPAAVLSSVPPPYQPVSVRHLDSQSSSEEPQDYLWLVNCESKKPEPNR